MKGDTDRLGTFNLTKKYFVHLAHFLKRTSMRTLIKTPKDGWWLGAGDRLYAAVLHRNGCQQEIDWRLFAGECIRSILQFSGP